MTLDPTLPRHFGRLAAWNVLANLTVPLVALVDTAVLGHLDEIRHLAGVALTAILFDVLFWTVGFLRMSTTGKTALAMGREDRSEAYAILYRSLALAASVGLFLLVARWPLRELGFAFLQGAPEVEAAGRAYFDARLWAAPATMANLAFLGWFLGRGEGRRVLAMTATANVVNVLLDLLFIFRFGWGAAGAGWATAIGQFAMLGIAVACFFATGPRPKLRRQQIFEGVAFKDLLRLNRDILLRTVFLSGSLLLFTNFSAVLGTVVLAANTILLRLFLVAAYWIDGAAYATESLSGTLAGAGRGEDLRRLIRLSLGGAVAFAGAYALVLAIAPMPFLRLLTNHVEVLEVASGMRFALIPVLLFGAAAFILDGLFIGWTAGRDLRNAMAQSALFGFLPFALLGLFFQDNRWLWFSLALFMAARVWTLGRRIPRHLAAAETRSVQALGQPEVTEPQTNSEVPST